MSEPIGKEAAGANAVPSEVAREDASLQVFGLLFVVMGLALLALATNELLNTIPPTFGVFFNIFVGGGIGFVLLVTGLYWYTVARDDAGFLLTDDALSFTLDRESGAREWIKFDRIVRITVRPWLMSPWIRRSRFVELEMEAREADVPVTDTFIVRLPGDGRSLLRQLERALGERLTVDPRIGRT